MPQTDKKVLYVAKVRTTGGRDGGVSKSSDGRLDVKHSSPGGPGSGTNPEQLFAAAWSACFAGAMGVAARQMKIAVPESVIDAEVDLCKSGEDYFVAARLNVSLPGMDRAAAQALVEAAHKICPYSKATRGNIEATVRVA